MPYRDIFLVAKMNKLNIPRNDFPFDLKVEKAIEVFWREGKD